MKGIIIVNAYATEMSQLNQAIRIKEEFEKLNINVSILSTDQICVYIDGNNFANDFSDIDFCVYLDKDKHILEMLDKLNVKIFNSSNSIQICDDKLLTHIYLANNNIPVPKTIGGVLCYYPTVQVKSSILDNVQSKLGYPVIIKECHGSCGKGIYIANNREQLEEIAQKVKLVPHLFQEYIEASKGVDIRVIVIGGKVVGGMKRENKADFRSNIEIGGVGKKVTLPQNYIELCERVANTLGLDYCGIDLLIDENNKPLVCEINSNAFFGMFEKITNINVAKLYAEYIVKVISKS